jgi:hypothetical protein
MRIINEYINVDERGRITGGQMLKRQLPFYTGERRLYLCQQIKACCSLREAFMKVVILAGGLGTRISEESIWS